MFVETELEKQIQKPEVKKPLGAVENFLDAVKHPEGRLRFVLLRAGGIREEPGAL